MAVPVKKIGDVLKNPGDGLYRLTRKTSGGIHSLTIMQTDIDAPLAGTLTCRMGPHTEPLDLATDQYIAFAGVLPFLDVEIAGCPKTEKFDIVLI